MHQRLVMSVVIWVVACVVADSSEAQPSSISDANTITSFRLPGSGESAQQPAHPLTPLIRMAERHLELIRREVSDYTCYLVKRERIDGRLRSAEHMFVKFRAPRANTGAPFSVYMKCLAPRRYQGREGLYVEGKYENDLIVKKGGYRAGSMTMNLNPEGSFAMRQARYPITSFGLEKLLERLIEVGEHDLAYGECEVKVVRGAKVDGRLCTLYEIIHPVPRSYFSFHVARIFLDDELQLPIRYASYTWPPSKGDPPALLEEYTYRDIKMNVGLSDSDFDPTNPSYGFELDED